MKYLSLIFIFALALLVQSCDSFVENVEDPIDTFGDQLLNDENQVDFMVNGIHGTFAQTYGFLSVYADGLSDGLVFDLRVQTATYPQYYEIDNGSIILNNNSVIDGEQLLGQLRLFADTLVGRALQITFTDSSKLHKALYHGYLYGGIARYFYASYFGLTEEQGGGAINAGPFIPSTQMYRQALDRLDLALPHAQSPYEERVVHSIKARIHLYLGEYTQAAAEAANGLVSGDPSLDALFKSESQNPWWTEAGNGRLQWVADPRFIGYVTSDPKEAVRIPLNEYQSPYDGSFLNFQNKYPQDASPTPFITWQEMNLIQAESAARDSLNTVALTLINSVRTSHGLDARTETALDSIYIERDKELFATGNRLMDQRRFDRWHLPVGTWKFLPITQREREANPFID